MITAKDARQLTESFNALEDVRPLIYSDIESLARCGRKSFEPHVERLSEEELQILIKELEDGGFKVTLSREDITITW